MIEQLGLTEEFTVQLDHRAIARNYLEQTKGIGSPSVTSISGGKSSAYMALRYPTDYYVFAVVLTDDPACQIQDKGLLKAIREKCPDFNGSRELDQTLINVLRLEQELGRQIDWVWGKSFDQVIAEHKFLPNSQMRFCTEDMKLEPIFKWALSKFPGEIIEMNIGFRADETNRVLKMLGAKQVKGGWDWANLGKCEPVPNSKRKVEWRFRQAPMWMDGIDSEYVKAFWRRKGWIFPDVSNCDYCLFHRPEEHRNQHQQHPDRAKWWIDQERRINATFRKGVALEQILYGSACPLFEEDQPCSCTD